MTKKVLILDNDHSILGAMSEALNYNGYDVKTLTDGENIFTDIDEYRPDLVLIDYILNGVNGGEICHRLKLNDQTTSIPVIIMSAYPRIIESLGNYGCNAFIAKPFDLHDLIFRIDELTANPDKTLNA